MTTEHGEEYPFRFPNDADNLGISPDACPALLPQTLVMAETGTFLIADISGYTEYLANSHVDHGPAIATDLITRVVEVMRPTFEVNKVEGDAVFSFSSDPKLAGADLIDVIDGTYGAFRRRLLSVGQATTCACTACGLAPRLDLKMIAHSGEFSRHQIAGRTELAGKDVIVVHRLLKNSLGFAGAASGYMLLTDACIRRMSIEPETESLTAHSEQYPHLGVVEGWVGSLQRRHEDQPSWRSPTAPIHEAKVVLAASPADVWSVLAPGRSDSCVTDRLAAIHEVIEWRPYERLVVEVKAPDATLLHEMALDRESEGTVATVRWFRGRRRRNARSWEEIAKRLANITALSLEQAQDRFARTG
ncbi:MAG: DUF2652 domain-containing protein [Acidimicrobiia bacterium]